MGDTHWVWHKQKHAHRVQHQPGDYFSIAGDFREESLVPTGIGRFFYHSFEFSEWAGSNMNREMEKKLTPQTGELVSCMFWLWCQE